ncbi:hypothetical protein EVAR_37852_1 [Eumeta japonica]|uniref:Uncharacterized protein n=1 Tax=Eumeta variegata TaxID=151549 RepID=A0A4C1X1Y4_EUMVA|nr:hypothetical protein EVAR_37852_1 [Eumeta japonica]
MELGTLILQAITLNKFKVEQDRAMSTISYIVHALADSSITHIRSIDLFCQSTFVRPVQMTKAPPHVFSSSVLVVSALDDCRKRDEQSLLQVQALQEELHSKEEGPMNHNTSSI